MRGERSSPNPWTTRSSGSSPHARGTPPGHQDGSLPGRFIPACAGNADAVRIHQAQPPVHPRMRGERSGSTGAPPPPGGSSPHARGTLTGPRPEPPLPRFIPACAGNALPPCGLRLSSPVHPRMRGERRPLSDDVQVNPGSSPHARGTRRMAAGVVIFSRFIPACAGNAESRQRESGTGAVHPRMRGERSHGVSGRTTVAGSSPHARGTRGLVGRQGRGNRFIPACAGNASRDLCGGSFPSVHPRMRGERSISNR